MQDKIDTIAQAQKIALELGLLEEEFEKILVILNHRIPTYTELGIFSVMWSEHCSYKNSIATIKTLPRKGGRLLVEAGEENAGLVDIGDGLAVAFKIESHNHPSAVEPYQGAATGVGGILRDIFTMGARPIAALNSLRFGSLMHPRTSFLVRGVVHGISDYGNSFGVPTVSGEVYFDECYNGNPLVNAMAVGIVEHGKTVSASAEGVGNIVMIVGSSTGRDGIHGASLLASAVFSEAAESLRPTVQVGDPFTEKLLLEASLEAIEAGVVVGMQDMGAAGICCSTSEMSAKAGTGMKIDLNRVPLREAGMSAYEIVLSESQERMLVVVKPSDVDRIRAIFAKWDLPAEIIGVVTDTGRVEIDYDGARVADIPSRSLALGGDQTPVYHRESKEPKYLAETRAFELGSLSDVEDPGAMLKALLSNPCIASKAWIYNQYDSMVRTNTMYLEGSDAAVIRVKGTSKGLAVKTDCNSGYVYLNPYAGGALAVFEAARNVACTGATPIAVTNCLNFGNPYDPEVFFQFREAVRGMGDACKVLETPVTGGNVSFYNESPKAAIYPTPVIGMLGVIDDIGNVVSANFKQEGDFILLIEPKKGMQRSTGISGSQYLMQRIGVCTGQITFDTEMQEELAQIIRFLTQASAKQLLSSAHDVSDGGVAIALAECCFGNEEYLAHGAKITLNSQSSKFWKRNDVALFGEQPGVIILSASEKNISALMIEKDAFRGFDLSLIGRVSGSYLEIDDLISCSVEELRWCYENALPATLDSTLADAD